jgi:hypothetical protein
MTSRLVLSMPVPRNCRAGTASARDSFPLVAQRKAPVGRPQVSRAASPVADARSGTGVISRARARHAHRAGQCLVPDSRRAHYSGRSSDERSTGQHVSPTLFPRIF